MEITLTKIEALADRVLAESAADASRQIAQLNEEIDRIRRQHAQRVAEFLDALRESRGLKIPDAVRRREEDGQVVLAWDDSKPEPVVEETKQPTEEPDGAGAAS